MDDVVEDRRKGFRFIPTLSWDSLFTALALAVSGFLYVQTIKTDQAAQAKDIQTLQKSVERVEADMKERTNRVENQQKERSDRLESLLKESNRTLQDELIKLRR